MKKRNAGGGDMTRKAAAKARRLRRQAKLRAAVDARLGVLVHRLGAAQARINELESQQPVTEATSDSAQGT